jgi:formamidopyrimidine-DNA glycosylase
MPELPEVETVTRALRPHLLFRKIIGIDTHTPKLRTNLKFWDHPEIIGQSIIDVYRRAKYLIVELSGLQTIIFHFGMSGTCRIELQSTPLVAHDHVVVDFDNRQSLRFNDPRRFGLVEVHGIDSQGELPVKLSNLPPEPLEDEFDVHYFRSICRFSHRPIKALMMDQNRVVGVGNIYASEALFRARIHPLMPCHRLSIVRQHRLVQAIKIVLTKAIAAGGTTIADFQSVDGREGKFNLELNVYGKTGESCPLCDRAIKRVVITGRSTFYCPKCQR